MQEKVEKKINYNEMVEKVKVFIYDEIGDINNLRVNKYDNYVEIEFETFIDVIDYYAYALQTAGIGYDIVQSAWVRVYFILDSDGVDIAIDSCDLEEPRYVTKEIDRLKNEWNAAFQLKLMQKEVG